MTYRLSSPSDDAAGRWLLLRSLPRALRFHAAAQCIHQMNALGESAPARRVETASRGLSKK
jgi:hypothetical protein